MSRSYKKTPVYQDGYGDKDLKWYKRSANKKVRRTTEIYSGKAYRKVYETWIFRDYIFRKTLNQYKIEIEIQFKHCLNCYGRINNLPSWIKIECKDKNFNLWNKTYYWK